MKKPFRVLVWIPSFARELHENKELTDFDIVVCWLIYSLHKSRLKRERKGSDVYHMDHGDFMNILSWPSFISKWNEKLEGLRKVFRVAQRGGYWSFQFTDATLDHKPQKFRNSPSYDWVYLSNPKAIAIYFYLEGKMTAGSIMDDWYKGQDMEEYYREHPLPKNKYKVMKFRDDLY